MKEADIYVMYRFGGIVAAFRFSGKRKEGVERSEGKEIFRSRTLSNNPSIKARGDCMPLCVSCEHMVNAMM